MNKLKDVICISTFFFVMFYQLVVDDDELFIRAILSFPKNTNIQIGTCKLQHAHPSLQLILKTKNKKIKNERLEIKGDF